MIRQIHIISLVTILLFSCGENRGNSYSKWSNSRILNGQSLEVKKSFRLLEKMAKPSANIKLTGCFSSLIDFELSDSPKSPHLVFLFYEINQQELMAKFYVDSTDVISLGYNISENNEDLTALKDLMLHNPTKSDKESIIQSFIDPKGFKTIETNYRNWARHMPSIGGRDTITSKQPLIQQKYNEKYLPDNAEIIGNILTIGNEYKELYYIIYQYGKSYSLELFDKNGNRKYSLNLFDQNFLAQNEDNFSRFYRSGQYLNFENCKTTNGEILVLKKDSIGIMDLFNKY